VFTHQGAIPLPAVGATAVVLAYAGLPLLFGVLAGCGVAALDIVFAQFQRSGVAFGGGVGPRHPLRVATRAAFRSPAAFSIRLKVRDKFFFPTHAAQLHVGFMIKRVWLVHR
jgi:hypothetical protein